MGNRKNECSLCGGKLRNGICMECGMDNRKCDDMYTGVLNRGQYQTRESAAKEPQAQGQREERQRLNCPCSYKIACLRFAAQACLRRGDYTYSKIHSFTKVAAGFPAAIFISCRRRKRKK